MVRMKFLAAPLFALGLLVAGASDLSAQGTTPPDQNAATVQINMRDADLGAFIDLIGQVTGKTFVVDPRVRGRVTVIAQEPMTPKEAYGIFLNVLELNRFTVVDSAGASRIVPMQIAKEIAGPTPDTGGGAGGFVTRVIHVQNASVATVMDVIRPLLPAEAAVSGYPESQLIVVSDQEANVNKIEALIRDIDGKSAKQIATIHLNNASAKAITDTLTAMNFAGPGMTIQADSRSNALLVSGSADFIASVRGIAGNLDKPVTDTGLTVIKLRYADAKDLAPTLAQLYTTPAPTQGGDAGGAAAASPASVVADEKTNSLIVSVPPDVLPAVRLAVSQLDTRPLQVRVEAVVFEVSAERFATLGVQFGALINGVMAGGVQFSGGPGSLYSLVTAILQGKVPADPGDGGYIGGLIPIGDNSGVAALINALAHDTTTNILSTPSIITLDNQEAQIVVARKVPFVTGTYSTVGDNPVPTQPFQTIQREDVGLTLKVTPHITADDTVRLAIDQEVSNLTNTTSAAGGEITARRALSTNIVVGDQRLVLLGGLLEEDFERRDQAHARPLQAADPRTPVQGQVDQPRAAHPAAAAQADHPAYRRRRGSRLRRRIQRRQGGPGGCGPHRRPELPCGAPVDARLCRASPVAAAAQRSAVAAATTAATSEL